MKNIAGRIAIVTGGAAGIGKALCDELAAQGAVVIVADIDAERAAQTAAAICAAGGRADARHLDVTREHEVSALVRQIAIQYGRLDYMFNNAGISLVGDARDIELDDWRRIVDINLWGVLHGVRAAYAIMARQGHGHIVNIASLAGLLTFPANTPYSTTKHAVVGLSLSLRAEAADLGVRISVVCPAYVQSDIFQSSPMLNVPRDKVMAQIPFAFMPASTAAKIILKRIACNQAIIVFPRYARLMWWLYRLHPALLKPIESKMIRDFRCVRTVPPQTQRSGATALPAPPHT